MKNSIKEALTPDPGLPAITPRSSNFDRLAKWAAYASGRPATFCLAVVIIVAWLITGPLFHYSDAWQLVINTGTTIVTFLMVFLIQATANRDIGALHIKLDELIRAQEGAHNGLLDLEQLSEEELLRIRARYQSLADAARKRIAQGASDSGTPECPPGPDAGPVARPGTSQDLRLTHEARRAATTKSTPSP
jgi:low affinity Fe/Cu permease